VPIYEYECEKCKHQFELIQKFSDPPVIECPLCQGVVRKVISSPGIMFKGSGWYVTDYSNKMKNPADEGKSKTVDKEKPAAEKKEPAKETPSSSSSAGSTPSPPSKPDSK
jgi:putative FmdB family regulatory protein